MINYLIHENELPSDRFNKVKTMFEDISGGTKVGFNTPVFLSEKEHADKNYALAYSMRGAGAELLMILRNEVPTVMAHDTNLFSISSSYNGKGSELLGRVLKIHPEYMTIEDKEIRSRELTQRGFLFASKDKDKYQVAKEIFEELCWYI